MGTALTGMVHNGMEMFGNKTDSYLCRGNQTETEAFQTSILGYMVLQFILGVFIAFGNILVLVAVWKFQELRSSLNVYVVNLALTDLTVGVIVLPLHIVIYAFPVIKSVFVICMLRYCILLISSGTSAALLTVMSVDRCLAIENPLVYKRIMTRGKAKMISLGVLIFIFGFCCSPLFGWNEWTPCSECTFSVVLPNVYLTVTVHYLLFCIFVVGILNIKTFITANKAKKDILTLTASFTGKPHPTEETRRSSFIKNKAAFKTVSIMFWCFAVCCMPYGIFTLWEINSLDATNRSKNNTVRVITHFLGVLNSGLNPFIYHWSNAEFNSAFRKIIRMKPLPKPIRREPTTISKTVSSNIS